MFDLNLKGKVAIITGGGRGLGRSIAERLADQKVTIIITDINKEMAEQTSIEISSKYSIEVIALEHNVASEESTKEVVKAVAKKFDKIDILVNNAGVIRDSRMMMMKKEDWELVLNVNLTGAFYCTKHISKRMLKQNSGRIVNIASVVGLMGDIGQANYSASKAGLIGLTKTSAKELAERGINVNAIAPGYIISDMTHTLSDEKSKEMMSVIPKKEFGTSDDVADTVIFLVSDMSKYITGQVINVDGGMVM